MKLSSSNLCKHDYITLYLIFRPVAEIDLILSDKKRSIKLSNEKLKKKTKRTLC